MSLMYFTTLKSQSPDEFVEINNADLVTPGVYGDAHDGAAVHISHNNNTSYVDLPNSIKPTGTSWANMAQGTFGMALRLDTAYTGTEWARLITIRRGAASDYTIYIGMKADELLFDYLTGTETFPFDWGGPGAVHLFQVAWRNGDDAVALRVNNVTLSQLAALVFSDCTGIRVGQWDAKPSASVWRAGHFWIDDTYAQWHDNARGVALEPIDSIKQEWTTGP